MKSLRKPTFIGLDTETDNGKAVLMCTPDRHFEPKSLADFIQFLFNGNCDYYVCYNLQFDAQAGFAWTTKLNQWKLARLGKTVYNGYTITWIPGKELTIQSLTDRKQKRCVYDVWQYYRHSLDEAARRFLGESKLEHNFDIEKIGEQINDPKYRDEIIAYCKQDARLVERLWELLSDAFDALEVETKRPISPAYLAGTFFLRQQRAPNRRTNELFKRCYFGGRSELLQKGTFGKIHAYDIHSAYPSVARNLARYEDLELVSGKLPDETAMMGVYFVWVDIPENIHLGPIPVRNAQGLLTYPVGSFAAWVDMHTLKMLDDIGFLEDIIESHDLVPKASRVRTAFPGIEELYYRRKLEPQLNTAIKWLLNGLYGKTAQIDKRWLIVDDALEADLYEYGHYLYLQEKYGFYSNYAYASHITGGTRCQLYRAMTQNSKSIIMVATDGLYTSEKLLLPETDNLGDWEFETYDRMLSVSAGVYTLGKDVDDYSYFRGFKTEHHLPSILLENETDSLIPIECGLPSTMLWSLRNDEPINKIGTWTRVLDINSDVKRNWIGHLKAGDLLDSIHMSNPIRLYMS